MPLQICVYVLRGLGILSLECSLSLRMLDRLSMGCRNWKTGFW